MSCYFPVCHFAFIPTVALARLLFPMLMQRTVCSTHEAYDTDQVRSTLFCPKRNLRKINWNGTWKQLMGRTLELSVTVLWIGTATTTLPHATIYCASCSLQQHGRSKLPVIWGRNWRLLGSNCHRLVSGIHDNSMKSVVTLLVFLPFLESFAGLCSRSA